MRPGGHISVRPTRGCLVWASAGVTPRTDQPMCGEPDFSASLDQPMCAEPDENGSGVMPDAHWSIAIHEQLRFDAHRLIVGRRELWLTAMRHDDLPLGD